MTLKEQCRSCAKCNECRRMYGKYMIYRAQGWRDGWNPDDGNEHPICGCRWYVRGESAEQHQETSSTPAQKPRAISRDDLMRRIAAHRSAS